MRYVEIVYHMKAKHAFTRVIWAFFMHSVGGHVGESKCETWVRYGHLPDMSFRLYEGKTAFTRGFSWLCGLCAKSQRGMRVGTVCVSTVYTWAMACRLCRERACVGYVVVGRVVCV